MLTVTIRYFAALRESRGRDHETLEVAEGTTAKALYATLFPPGPLGALPVAYAINLTYVSGDTALSDGDELAFIPPVGGG
ncbi:MAG: MoaD/ThiS family protein [Alphaproteobacteria bacterium]|nr:MoaD/ThiS family protein [Alphaproteobacteria bacterium]